MASTALQRIEQYDGIALATSPTAVASNAAMPTTDRATSARKASAPPAAGPTAARRQWPTTIPAAAPTSTINSDSQKIIHTTRRRRQPMARRTPISRIRSSTDTCIVFQTAKQPISIASAVVAQASPSASRASLLPPTYCGAAMAASPQRSPPASAIATKVENNFGRMDLQNVKYARTMFYPVFGVGKDPSDSLLITLSTEIKGLDIHYSFDTSIRIILSCL